MSSVDSERIRIIETVFGLSPFISYRGGKSLLARKIVSVFPPHEVYVEPMVGGGSVYFAKKPVEKEVISDIDKSLMSFYGALKKGDIKRCDLTPNRNRLDRVRRKRNSGKKLSPCEYLYLNKLSFGGTGTSYSKTRFDKCKGSEARKCGIKSKNQDKYAERLKNTKIEHGNFKDKIKKYDSKRTLFYIDPPYPKTNVGGYVDKSITPSELKNALKGIKGKFVLSYNDIPMVRNEFCKTSKFKCKKIKTTYSMSNKGTRKKGNELLISNF